MAKQTKAEAYAKAKDAAGARSRAISQNARDIGHLPPVKNSARKARGWRSFRAFCECYFPLKFALKWSADHLKMIAAIEKAIIFGGLFALAMPRGSGKTTLCEIACIWALLTGRKRFLFLIGSSEAHALGCLENIKTELGNNELLLEDYPEVCYPIKCLEGESRRANGQLFLGERTSIGWAADELILPTIPGSPAAGSVVRVAGITGNIRGALHSLDSGESIRPDLAILDDPQTDESAKSLSQNAQRESIINGAVLGLAGPGKAISALMPCTVIQRDDMVDRILDRALHPEWHGERTKMVYAWPEATALWDEYAKLRAESQRAGGEGEEATAFYAANREAMDLGAEVSWPERHRPDELSGLQHAINLRLRNPAAFASEYQNEPLIEDGQAGRLTAAEVSAKCNGVAKDDVPASAAYLTFFVDVHQHLLYWGVAAWGEGFDGAFVNYGTWPEQENRYFAMRDARITLGDVARGAGKEGAIKIGLESLVSYLVNQTWVREDGAPLQIAQGMVDANWGDSTNIVYDACRRFGNGKVFPSHGKGVTASGIPLDAAKAKKGERVGPGWRIPSLADSARKFRHVIFDANYWKSFIAARWRTAPGDPGSLSLYGDSPNEHRNFAEHCTAEYAVETQGRGRRVDEWKLPPNKPDNHWGDVAVGCAVAASIAGAKLLDIEQPGRAKRKRVSWADRHKPSEN